jgi:hypothetical protein
MKTLAFLITAMALAATPALAADKFPPPDLTLDQPKPAQVKPKPAKAAPLTKAKSQWNADDSDKPAKNFGDGANSACCKLSVTARQRPLYPNIGPDSSPWYPDPDQPSASDQAQ